MQKISGIKCNIFIPLGIGIIITAILMNISYKARQNLNVEMEARKLGMIYPSDIKAINIEPQGE